MTKTPASVGKKALVTGASEGIGRALALELAHQGYQVRGVARNQARLAELERELGAAALPSIVADLSQSADVVKISTELESGGYDLLINNAGYSVYGAFYATPLAANRAVVEVNVIALMNLAHAFLKGARAGAALVNVASTLSYFTMAKQGVYCATKHFVRSFSDALWLEQQARGVYVQCLCPGATRTLFNSRAGGTEPVPDFLAQTPEQVAALCVRELRRRKRPVVVSGLKNKLMVWVFGLLPERWVVKALGAIE